jgi:hypothetical protein
MSCVVAVAIENATHDCHNTTHVKTVRQLLTQSAYTCTICAVLCTQAMALDEKLPLVLFGSEAAAVGAAVKDARVRLKAAAAAAALEKQMLARKTGAVPMATVSGSSSKKDTTAPASVTDAEVRAASTNKRKKTLYTELGQYCSCAQQLCTSGLSNKAHDCLRC